MRLIGILSTAEEAFRFSSHLTKEGIANQYDSLIDAKTKKQEFRIWVIEEDKWDKADELYQLFIENPQHPRFDFEPPPLPRLPPLRGAAAFRKLGMKKKGSYPLTNFFLALCILLFLLSSWQKIKQVKEEGVFAAETTLDPIQEALFFDYPLQMQRLEEAISAYPVKNEEEISTLPQEGKELYRLAQETPVWKGAVHLLLHPEQTQGKIPLFEKIREGELWRLFTPVLLHGGILHILFNMAWLWPLGRMMEERMGKARLLLFILLTAIISNVAQYLMSGPNFIGFSGIIVGMVGFIWQRERAAPWEGYPLHRGTILFVVLFVLAMFALELISFFLQYLQLLSFAPPIANTAHIVGGLVGVWLGKLRLFSREYK